MNAENKKCEKLALLQIPEEKRDRLIKQLKERLQQRVLEARMWRELLQVDNLTINGHIIWNENQQPSKTSVRSRRK